MSTNQMWRHQLGYFFNVIAACPEISKDVISVTKLEIIKLNNDKETLEIINAFENSVNQISKQNLELNWAAIFNNLPKDIQEKIKIEVEDLLIYHKFIT